MTTKEYFYALNYTLANEDTQFEYEIVKKRKPKKIVSVCGSGSRCFPLLTEATQDIYLVDLSREQLMLAQLREACYKNLSYDEFLLFWGYPPYRANENCEKRKEVLAKLNLGIELDNYFKNLFSKNDWNSILYIGKWEKTFAFFSKIVTKVFGEELITEFFECKDLKAQEIFIKKKFPHLKWKVIMGILGNKALFNALLYKGDFIKKNVPETYIQYYDKAFKQLMSHDLVRTSYFMQLCFLGEIRYPEGNLIEAQKGGFNKIKKCLKSTKVHYLEKDIISSIKGLDDIDFVSISDVPSYFSGDLERDFFQMIRPSLAPNGLVVNRNYLRIPKANREGYIDIVQSFQKALMDEKVQMYRIEVLENQEQD